ncbi:ATP-binding protein, partial [Rhodococcus opacus]
MPGRIALVIGSECTALGTLGFTGELAGNLHEDLTMEGSWRTPDGQDGPVLNPTTTDLKKSITDAFASANAAKATLLIAFVGHGVTTAQHDFYLLAVDSPEVPNSDTAFHLGQGIRERLNQATDLDGLVVVVDACQAGAGVAAAAQRWVDILGDAAGRMELLVASGETSAYDGCFTRTLMQTFKTGLERRGDSLLCVDLVPELTASCELQLSQHLSFINGGAVERGDPGLWLVPNRARRQDAVTGRPSAGLVDQLTRGAVLTLTVHRYLTAIVDAEYSRLRLVVGPAGSGKSTILSLLIRPQLVDSLTVTANYITAAVFLDATSTLETLTTELTIQLARRIDGFNEILRAVTADLTEDDRAALDSFEINVVRTLERCTELEKRRVRLILDGLDQAGQGARDLIMDAVAKLTYSTHPMLANVRVIAGVRSGTGMEDETELAHGHRIVLSPPTPEDLLGAINVQRKVPTLTDVPRDWNYLLGTSDAGGWLIARLISELSKPDLDQSADLPIVDLLTLVQARLNQAVQQEAIPEATLELVSVLVAAGIGPVLPISLLSASLRERGYDLTVPHLRDIIATLGALVSRGKPGVPEETLGIAHTAFTIPFETALKRNNRQISTAHASLVAVLDELNSVEAASAEIAAYAMAAGPRHYLASGDPDGAMNILKKMDGPRAADNRDQWASWLPAFEQQAGRDHRSTLEIRSNLARSRGESGDLTGAITEYQHLLDDRRRILGNDHPDTLTTRNNLGNLRGENGDLTGAIAELEILLDDQRRILGNDHPQTLTTRVNLARWRGENGDLTGAIAE